MSGRPFPTAYVRGAWKEQPWFSVPPHNPADGDLRQVRFQVTRTQVKREFKVANFGTRVEEIMFDERAGFSADLMLSHNIPIEIPVIQLPSRKVQGIAPDRQIVLASSWFESYTREPIDLDVRPEFWQGQEDIRIDVDPKYLITPPVYDSSLRFWSDLWWSLTVKVEYRP